MSRRTITRDVDEAEVDAVACLTDELTTCVLWNILEHLDSTGVDIGPEGKALLARKRQIADVHTTCRDQRHSH